MRNFILNFIICLISFPVSAQHKERREEWLNTHTGEWSATLTGAMIPLPSISFGIQPGAIYKFSDRFSWLSELTFRVGNKDSNDTKAYNKKFFRVKQELRYHYYWFRRLTENYIGLQTSYSFRSFNDLNSFYYDDLKRDSVYYFDKARIKSPIITLTLQIGSIYYISDKISIDVFGGIGARFINTHIKDIVNPRTGGGLLPKAGPAITPSYRYAGWEERLNLNGGFRIVYLVN